MASEQREMTGDNLRAMLKQEASGQYSCLDYLSMTPWHKDVYHVNKRNGNGGNGIGSETRIDEYCREQIAEWSFRVVDYFRIDREVVSLSISFLDRFLSKCRCDRTSFKLAATTTLNLAVKLLYPCKLGDLGILSDLSRGEFDMADVADMERCILHSLSWRLHPPTPVALATLLLDYVSFDAAFAISNADLDDVYDVSSFFCDLAVCDYFFVSLKSSTVAVAAIQNALEGMFGPDNTLNHDIIRAARKLSVYSTQDLAAVRNRLWELYERSEECALHNKVSSDQEASWNGGIFVKKMSAVSSPVSISTSCTSTRPELSYSKQHAELIQNNTSW